MTQKESSNSVVIQLVQNTAMIMVPSTLLKWSRTTLHRVGSGAAVADDADSVDAEQRTAARRFHYVVQGVGLSDHLIDLMRARPHAFRPGRLRTEGLFN